MFACSPEEVIVLKTLVTKVQPESSGTVARISNGNSNVVQLVAIPTDNYIFQGWLYGNETTSSDSNNPIFVKLESILFGFRVINNLFHSRQEIFSLVAFEGRIKHPELNVNLS